MIAALAFGLSVVVGAGPAWAYPQDPNNCNDSTITWHFDSSWDDYPTAKSRARAAIDLWNQPRDYAGARLMTVTEGSGGVSVQLKTKPRGDYGAAECVHGASFWINKRYVNDAGFVWKMSRH